MRCWIELNRSALIGNYGLFRSAAEHATVVPVLKSNAYGHGLPEVYCALASERPAWLGVNYLYEAEELRTLGFKERILIVGPVAPSDLAQVAAAEADFVLGSPEQLTAWLAAAIRPRAHVKMDTGLGRQGFPAEDAAAIATALTPFKDRVAGICSHFANVEDVSEHDYAEEQIRRFEGARTAFRTAGMTVNAHIASSASALLMKNTHYDLIRIGIALYGLWPSRATRLSYLQTHKKLAELAPVLSWRSTVASLKPVSAGAFVGYGCTYRANHDMRLALIPVGYFEGFPRIGATNSSYVLIKGSRCPLVGRISMNMMMVDVTHLPKVAVGELVTLIGEDGTETLSPSNIGDWAQTINYEIVTKLNPRIPRRLVDTP